MKDDVLFATIFEPMNHIIEKVPRARRNHPIPKKNEERRKTFCRRIYDKNLRSQKKKQRFHRP